MNMTTSQVHVVAAVRNRIAITKKFIDKLQKQTFNNLHLLLIDDGSSDGTPRMVAESPINSTIIYGDGNLWWGGALHQAYLWFAANKVNQEDYVLIMNDDVIIEDDFIEKGIICLYQKEKALLTCYGYGLHNRLLMDGPIVYRFASGKSYITKEVEAANCASTRALFFRVRDFLDIGGFHPVLLPHYGSDYEFTIRAWKKGYEIISDSSMKYFYDEQTTGNMYYLDLLPGQFMKKMFSRKSVYNPLYKLTFIMLACPVRYIPINLCFQITRYIKNIFSYIKVRIAGKKERKV